MLKLDLHVHSCFSEDAEGTPKEIITSLQQKGLHGVAITDHNTVKGALQAVNQAPKDFVVIPGIEISTKDGHLLGLNVTEPIPRGLSVDETVDEILDKGGIPVVPHLFRNMSGIKLSNFQRIVPRLTTMEVFNGCSLPKSNIKTARIAHQYHLGGTGGSDSHHPFYAGGAYTLVDTTDPSVDAVLSALTQKKTWGDGSTMPLDYRQDRMMKSIKQYFQRGLKRI
jgi:hypothetical protein